MATATTNTTTTTTASTTSTSTANTKSNSQSQSRYVPIRPLTFRPLLPKPAATGDATAKSTCTATNISNLPTIQTPQIKIERRRSDGTDTKKPKKAAKERKTKKRTQSQPTAPNTLPSTISPASLVYKKKKTASAKQQDKSNNNHNNSNTKTAGNGNGKGKNINSILNNAVPQVGDTNNALRPSKVSTKVMLSVDATLDEPSLTTGSSFDLNSSTDLYLLGGVSSPSSMVDPVSLWDESSNPVTDDLVSMANSNADSTSISSGDDNSPIDSLALTLDTTSNNTSSSTSNDDLLISSYSDQLLSLDSYLTPEPDDEAIQEIRESLTSFIGTVNS